MNEFFSTTLKILNDGRNWHKGSIESGDKVCLVGAMYKSFFASKRYAVELKFPTTQFYNAMNSVQDVICEQFPDRIYGKSAFTPNFNDHPDTTFDDVRCVIEKAALIYDEKKATT